VRGVLALNTDSLPSFASATTCIRVWPDDILSRPRAVLQIATFDKHDNLFYGTDPGGGNVFKPWCLVRAILARIPANGVHQQSVAPLLLL
jgi:hypothetical protein